MKNSILLIVNVLFLVISILSCKSQVAIDDLSRAPDFTAPDSQFANIFKSLDGVWQGTFYIYTDARGQTTGNASPQDFDENIFDKLPLVKQLVVEVRQEYVSESPYFQRVKIRDEFHDRNGDLQVVESRGVNKIQNGKMWCVVKKPDETVIHSGNLVGENIIIWQCDLRSPLKIEHFREIVTTNEYKILGWGYYGDDDPELSPRYWFKAEYRKKR